MYYTRVCEETLMVEYREKIYTPQENGVYEKKLALALLDVSFAVSTANCINILPLVNPPGFTKQYRVEGLSPINGENVMYAYVFWNTELSQAVISFTGTHSFEEWQSDFMYQQVPPTLLNGYRQGMLMHMGFYNIYIAIRQKLFDWWNFNQSSINCLYITGHSLGGALSTICAFDFAHVFNDIYPIHYSFAAPRCGNILFSDEFNNRLPTSLRVNNTEDVVPQLPLATFNNYTYKHTLGNLPFTVSLGSLIENHVKAYRDYLPECPQVATCFKNSS